MGMRVEAVLLANVGDSASVRAAADDLGLNRYRRMSHLQFDEIMGSSRQGLPLFVLFKKGQPVMTMSDGMTGRLRALESFLPMAQVY